MEWLSKNKKYELSKKERNLSIIGNKIRLATLYLLFEKKNKMSFNDIARNLGVENNKLAYHIALLKKGQFIENEMRFDNKEGKSFSFYGLSEKGSKTIGLIEEMSTDLKESEKNLDDVLK
jgi:predicted ArsR family transcriptional regulator